MKQVFVVTRGEYSDYRIEGVFSSQELAEAFASRVKEAVIEPWDLDERKEWITRSVWHSTIYLADGRLDTSYRGQCIWDEVAPAHLKLRAIEHTFLGGSDYVSVQSYISHEHAIKVAIEIRQKILRERVIDPKYQHPRLEPFKD